MILNLFSIVIQFWYLEEIFKNGSFLQYSANYFTTFFTFSQYIIYFYAMNKFSNQLEILKGLFFVTSNSASGATLRKLYFMEYKEHCMCFGTVVAVGLCGFALISTWAKSSNVMENSMLDYYALKSILPLELAVLILLLNAFGSLITVTVLPTCFVYVMFHVKLSILHLRDYTYQMNIELKNKKNMPDLDILKFLNSIVQEHVEIKRFNDCIFDSNQILYFLYICSGCITVFMSFALNFGPYDRYTVVYSSIVLGSFMYFVLMLTDAAEEYIELGDYLAAGMNNLAWYDWPVNCQKIYLMMLMQFSIGIKVTLFLFLDINRELLKKVCRTVYSLLNVFYSVKNKSH